MTDIIQLAPNKWVTEQKLTEITGLKPGTIERARKCWLIGREYMHISPEGEPKPTSQCMYNTEAINRWIEQQASKQPGAHP
ncbi:excisionase family protein [Pseudocitrobacter sp. 73]|uniref:excisionase family protein n=1 Tax=Pseudocitrobacter sp. 73 TaxID=2605731 RepID=UPI0011ECBA3A|nr:excisionase family protein [Pseudocitrobacter sp. 73]KAA1050607.1 excisionase [Pseudocitrobacter sp. 73]